MSSYMAIAGVSATLRNLLQDRMEGRPVTVTIAPPDLIVDDDNTSRINLFLYKVTENASLKNQEIPGTGSGDYGHPPLSLDLHYLLTAHGKSEKDEVEAHQMLGDAMRVLHDYPYISDQLTQIHDPAPHHAVLDPSLLGQFEKIKIILDNFSLEDFTKIWTAFSKPFRLSAAYTVSVIQIETKLLRQFPRPVGELPSEGPRVYVLPSRTPYIQEVRLRRIGDPPNTERTIPYASIGDTLILIGTNITSDARLFLGSVDATSNITRIAGDRIETVIPDDPALQPGPQTIKVMLFTLMGNPSIEHFGLQSNSAVFMLVPRIDSLTTDLGSTPRTLQVNGSRLYDPLAENMALIGDTTIPKYSTSSANIISFELPSSLVKGRYPVRVRVNGAENIDGHALDIP